MLLVGRLHQTRLGYVWNTAHREFLWGPAAIGALHSGVFLEYIQRDATEYAYASFSVLEPPQNQQVANPSAYMSEDVKPKTLPLDKNLNHQLESPGERRKWVDK